VSVFFFLETDALVASASTVGNPVISKYLLLIEDVAAIETLGTEARPTVKISWFGETWTVGQLR
jgi:hypothetical protein